MERELRHADDCAGTKERKKSRRKKKERKKERKKMRTTTSPFPNPGQIGQQLDGLPSTNKFGKPPSTQGFLSFLIRLLQIVGHGKKGSLAMLRNLGLAKIFSPTNGHHGKKPLCSKGAE